MNIIEGTRIRQESEDLCPPVALDYVRGHCPKCASDVPAEYHCLMGRDG